MAKTKHPKPPRGGATGPAAAHEERYRTLFNSIDEGFCVIEIAFDAKGRPCDYRFLETNPAFGRQTGLVASEGKRIRELAPAHEEHWFEIYGRVALHGEPVRFVQEARALDRWFDVYAFPIDDPKLHRVAVLFNDVSGRIRAERSARLLSDISEDLVHISREEDLAPTIGAKVGAHFHLSQCALVEIDHQRRLAVVKDSWHEPEVPSVCGAHPLDDFLAEEFWQQAREGRALIVGDVTQAASITRVERFRQLQIGSLVTIPLLREGEWRYLFVLYRREPTSWRGDQLELAREVASRCWSRVERLRAEVALRESEERLRLIIENAREYAIFSTDLERRVTSWNVGAERLLGYAEAEIMGQSADIIFTREDRRRLAPEREATHALREGRAANERWHLRKDGTRFWGSGAVMAMRGHDGSMCGLLKIMRDQTEEQAIKEDLERSQQDLRAALQTTEQARAEAVAAGRAKDQFLAALSHELRTPLNPVLMISSEAAADPSLPPQVRQDFETVRKNIELEARLIDDMLDLSRITQGKLSLHERRVDLHGIVREAVETVRNAAAEKDIAPTMNLTAARSRVRGDPARLQQIFINLLNNAIKFTRPGGTLLIDTLSRDDTNEITVRIADSGIGLTSEELARVFRPFVQGGHAESEGSSAHGGLGLGLAIVEGLAEAHGGRVRAVSLGRGHGAAFSVDLPLAREAGDPEPASRPAARRLGPDGRLSILLVEDHADTRTALERTLTRRGHTVTAAGSIAEALEASAQAGFDLLISDLGLPDGDGCQLLGQLRQSQPRLRAIALSGFGMEDDLRRSAEAGFSVHLVKPVLVSRLDAAIAQRQGESVARSG